MKQMVLVCPIIETNLMYTEVVVINKLRPSFQRGWINLPGGKVESGEPPIVAAKRELVEETNLTVKCMVNVGYFGHDDWMVHVFTGIVSNEEQIRSVTDEIVEIFTINKALTHPKIINNLRAIIPKCLLRLDNWVDDRI